VVIVADAPYDRVAFAGLWDRQRDRYFVEDHGVVSAPSATTYAVAFEHGLDPRGGKERRAAVVDPDPVHPSGTAAAESLRRAQLAALDESKRRTGSWATLTVFGSTQ